MVWGKRSRHERGYGLAWTKLRAQALARDKHLCQRCLKVGRIEPATCVDHIKAKSAGGTDDLSNLQSLSKACHLQKTLEEIPGYKPKVRIGVDGWPIEDDEPRGRGSK